MEQRNAGNRADDVGEGTAWCQGQRVVDLAEWGRGVVTPVAEPRGVSQKVADRDRLFGRFGDERSLGVDRGEYAWVGELWQKARHRIVELKASLLVEHQHRDGRYRLGHAGDPESRVERHGLPPRTVPHADRSRIHQLAGAGHHEHVSRCTIAVHLRPKMVSHVIQAPK